MANPALPAGCRLPVRRGPLEPLHPPEGCLPAWMGAICTAAAGLPVRASTFAPSKPLPATAKPFPAAAKPLSSPSEPIPTAAKPLPTASEPLPATSCAVFIFVILSFRCSLLAAFCDQQQAHVSAGSSCLT